jgi:HSP20 family protein
MSLIRWEPFREMDEFFRRYSSALGRSNLRTFNEGEREWAPAANISETDKEYLIKAELPEVKKEDVKITLENGIITISGERKQQKEEKEENEIRVESFYGTFTRSFSLPENIDPNGVRAESKDGVLKVRIPKKEAAKPKAITVQVQ